jgi:hypothetical protein
MSYPPEEYRPPLRPPQFRLSTLLLLITGLAAVFASLGFLGAYGGPAVVLLLLCVAAHLAAARLGDRLRANGDRPIDEHGRPLPRWKQTPLRPDQFAPASRLSERSSMGLPVLIVTGLGVLVGGFLGGAGLAWLNWEKANLLGIALGTLASGVLGGMMGFWLGSFVKVTTTAGMAATKKESRSTS